jgi:outer membrane biosynthesis protein TonB
MIVPGALLLLAIVVLFMPASENADVLYYDADFTVAEPDEEAEAMEDPDDAEALVPEEKKAEPVKEVKPEVKPQVKPQVAAQPKPKSKKPATSAKSSKEVDPKALAQEIYNSTNLE